MTGSFEFTYGRCPTCQIGSSRVAIESTRPYKELRLKGIPSRLRLARGRYRSLHFTRHTMITWARRGGARREVLEKITHNAAGSIIEQYTHWHWEPLCQAVLCLDYAGMAAARALRAAKPALEASPMIMAAPSGGNLQAPV